MSSITSSQLNIKERILKDIEREIGMCDSYTDLLLFASVLNASSSRIYEIYAKDFGEDALNRALEETTKKVNLNDMS
jgi:hypothetical protein